jgi:hypothetical protein
MILVGIHGKAGSGKDTIGNILAGQFDFAIRSFAEPIKRTLAAFLDVPVSKMDDREWREKPLDDLYYGKTPRELMQTFGTEWGRNHIGQDIWIRLCLDDPYPHESNGRDVARVAITDVRFPNEAAAIRARGGHIIHIYREKTDASTTFIQHTSEQGLPCAADDFSILNNGTIFQLERAVAQLVSWILKCQQVAMTQKEEAVDEALQSNATRTSLSRH